MSEELKFSDLKTKPEPVSETDPTMLDTANTNTDNVLSDEQEQHDHILGMYGDRVIRTSEPNGLDEIIADYDFWAFRFCPMCGIDLFA